MNVVRAIGRALCAPAMLAFLAGCSGATSGITPAQPGGSSGTALSAGTRVANAARSDNSLLPPNAPPVARQSATMAGFMDANAAAKPLIFVSDAARGVVDIYAQAGKNQKPVGRIAGFDEPQGIATDSNGNLYVANTNGSDVRVYAPPYTHAAAMTLADPGQFPGDVAVSSKGLVAVTNVCTAPGCPANSGSVSFFAKGSTKACATVADSSFNFARVFFAAFDANGLLYVDGLNGGYQASVGTVFGGCNARGISNIGLIYTIGFAGGIQIDRAGRIAIVDAVRTQVDTYDPPVSGNFGNPVSTSPLDGSVSPLGIALLASGNHFYVADSAGAGVAREYAYTAGGAPQNAIAVGGQPLGVAVTPYAKP